MSNLTFFDTTNAYLCAHAVEFNGYFLEIWKLVPSKFSDLETFETEPEHEHINMFWTQGKKSHPSNLFNSYISFFFISP